MTDIIGHVTIWEPTGYFLLVVLIGTKPLSITVSKIFSGECDAMVDVTLIRHLNKGQKSFILVPIDFSYATSYRLSIVTFTLGRTV